MQNDEGTDCCRLMWASVPNHLSKLVEALAFLYHRSLLIPSWPVLRITHLNAIRVPYDAA